MLQRHFPRVMPGFIMILEWVLSALVLLLPLTVTAQQYVGAPYNNSKPILNGAEITFWNVFDANKKNTSLLNYHNLNNGQRQDPKKVQRAVIFVHGLNQDPETYMSNMLFALARAQAVNPAANSESVAIVAPFFANGDDKNVGYPWTAGLPPGQGSTSSALVWKGSQWAGGSNNQYPYKQTSVSSYDVLDQMVTYFSNKTLYPILNQIVVAGHSLGGQMMVRYASVGKNLGLTRPVRYWIGNPNDYLSFNSSRPATRTPSSCSGYDDWRNGFSNYSPTYGASLVAQGRDAVFRNWQSKSKIYAKGTLDLGDDSSSCAPLTNGQNRDERFFEQIALYPPTKLDNVDYESIGHDAGAMMTSTSGQARLFFDNLSGDGSQSADFGNRIQTNDSPNPNNANLPPPPIAGVGSSNSSYQGCWTDASDDVSGHALAQSASIANNTVESCTAACAAAGFSIAGMLNGNECKCGNSLSYASLRVVDRACSTKCPGDASQKELCGGPSRLSVWSAAFMQAPPSSVKSESGSFQYLACYNEANETRALSAQSSANDQMTVENCAAFCTNYQYMGLEYARECYCGNSIGSNISTLQSDCNFVCAGNATEICGGSSRLTIYNNTASSMPTNSTSSNATSAQLPGYQGCFTDSTSDRALSTQAYSNSNNATISMCLSACSSLGLPIAGAEYGTECWCGSEIKASTRQVADAECSLACPGNASSQCGAGNRLSVYSNLTSLPKTLPPAMIKSIANYTFIGCYTDLPSNRTLSQSGPGGSIDACAASAQQAPYFGVEYGSECYFGSDLAPEASLAPEGDCNMACSTNSSQYCGAGYRIGVYKLKANDPSTSSNTVFTASVAASTTSSTSPMSTTLLTSSTTLTASMADSTPENTLPSGSSSTTAPLSPSQTPVAQYQGCFLEPSNARALPNRVPTPPSGNTNAACQAACHSANYTVAGTEYASECWCGNSLASGTSKVDDSKCNMSCSGNSSEFCGAGFLLSVYSQQPALIQSPPSSPTQIGDYSLFGCVSDNTSQRTLSDLSPQMQGQNSLEACASACAGYLYFGAEYARECYCGNSLRLGYTNSTLDKCNMPCTGNATEYCGAGNLLSLYYLDTRAQNSVASTPLSTSMQTSTSIATASDSKTSATASRATSSASASVPSGYKDLGCFADGSNRALSSLAYSDDGNTPSRCASQCKSNGFKYAGVEYGRECWCSNFILNSGADGGSGQAGCTMPCSGDQTQTCGGSDRMEIYQDMAWQQTLFTLQRRGPWNFTDCFIDTVSPRSLNMTLSIAGDPTVERCLDSCTARNLTVCGVEYGGECYGSQVMPTAITTAPSSGNPDPLSRGCSMPCKGNSSTACGGPSRLDLYTFVDGWSETVTVM